MTQVNLSKKSKQADMQIRPAVAKGEAGKDWEQTQTIIYRMDKQQGPTG